MRNKKRMMLYLFLLGITLYTMYNLKQKRVSPIPHRDYQEIVKEGVLHIDTEYSQTGYFVSKDTIEGFQYELAKAISKISGLDVQIHLEMNLNKSFNNLKENKCDIIARNISISSQLKDEYSFTEPIVFNKQVLIQKTDSQNKPIRNQIKLGGKTIYIPENSPAKIRLINLQQEIGDTIYIKEDKKYSSEQLIMMIANGDIEYAVCDYQTAEKMKTKLPQIDLDTDISFTQLQSWALRKDAIVLADSLNHWLKQIKENGQFEKIYKSYF